MQRLEEDCYANVLQGIVNKRLVEGWKLINMWAFSLPDRLRPQTFNTHFWALVEKKEEDQGMPELAEQAEKCLSVGLL